MKSFCASRRWVQRWTQRHSLASVALHGAGGSVHRAEAAARMTDIPGLHHDLDPENIFNMNETGLFYRCLPNRSFVPVEQPQAAGGTRAMKAKERVTLLLACNATGSRTVPVAVIGNSVLSLCFRPPGFASPLPYFSQRNSWMDGVVFKKCVYEVFSPCVRRRTTDKVALGVDNLASDDDISDEQMLLIALPLNTTAVCQPFDAGAIAAPMLRYKRRLLCGLVA